MFHGSHHLLTPQEKACFLTTLEKHSIPHDHLKIQVLEEQESVDMNDLHYFVIVAISATYIPTTFSKTYHSRVGSGTWISSFEKDWIEGRFGKA